MTSRQLLGEVTPPRPVAPGRPASHDYEHQRGGVCRLFLACEPLRGWRQVTCSQRRTRIDWAHSRQGPGRGRLPGCRADRAGARRPRTPTRPRRWRGVLTGRGQAAGRPAGTARHAKHGSWLNMAEIELAMLAGQCLDRRRAERASLQREVAAWPAARNQAGRGVNWRFTTKDARIKLQHLYPTTHD
jgi:hypothetical protein